MTVLALDLGSTRIKAARFEDSGQQLNSAEQPAPLVEGDGTRREFDGTEFLHRAMQALFELQPRQGERLGIASQRSSFLLFDAHSGKPVTPVISWQDRRGAEWIARHADAHELVGEISGLPLSAHYVGPKLAAMFATDRELARRASSGQLRLGTLETFLIRQLSPKFLHVTDETMAARTLLFDSRCGAWSQELCDLFGVHSSLLPHVAPSSGRSDDLGPLVLSASIADQSAGALHAVGAGPGAALINFGTGSFVVSPTGARWQRRHGYLTSLLHSRGTVGEVRERGFALEGTVNAGAGLVVRDASPAAAADHDLPDDAMALVDENGIGAPHWRADLGPIWSPAAENLAPLARRRVAEQGLCFRVREILSDLGCMERRLLVAGGALHDAAFAQRLADCLGRPIEVCLEPEATLAGVAALACDREFGRGLAQSRVIVPDEQREALDVRFRRWRDWVAATLAS